MVCRRKTKTERELVADIRKAFDKECEKYECGADTCPHYDIYDDCIEVYIKSLVSKVRKQIEEEEK